MDLSFLENISTHWLNQGATDVLLRVGEVPRARLNGDLISDESGPVSAELMEAFWRACDVDPEKNLETDVRYRLADGGYLRANLYRTMGGLAAALRPLKEIIPPLNELGVPVDLLREWSGRKSGLILVTGPTGAGKSTTLASTLDDLNQYRREHIVTIEDPIEYIFSNKESFFSQREIHSDTGGFAQALRASLRQNPDIIMLGEIRDEETAEIALRAAETGHLVLASLHSSGVAETMERLTNLFPFDKRQGSLQLLSAQLIGVLAQQLLPGIDGGLQLVCEYMQNRGAIRKWIREGQYSEILDFLRRQENPNSQDILTALLEAYHGGHITEEVARNAAPHTSDFDRAIRGIS